MSPWQIAIETSSRHGSLALLRGDVAIEQTLLPAEASTARLLAPALQQLVDRLRAQDAQLGWVSVGVGPGSFTGLRIGVTTAKSLAYALGCTVAGCDTLAAMLTRLRKEQPGYLCYDATINAYRGQVFWRREAADGRILVDTRVADRELWENQLDTPDTLFAGELWGAPAQFSPPTLHPTSGVAAAEFWFPRADAIGSLGWDARQRGGLSDPFALRPSYLRASAAEEKRRQQHSPSSTTPPSR